MFKKILKWTGIVLIGMLAVLLIANAIFVWRSSAALASRLQAIRDAGDPVSLADLAREPLPAEDNAATFLRRAESDLGAMQKELAAFYDRTKDDGRGRVDAEGIQTLTRILDAHPDTVALVERAAACPDFDPQLDYALGSQEFLAGGLDRFSSLKAAVRLLDHRATVLLSQRKHDEAARAAIGTLRLARHYDHNPLIVGYLVATACRGIAHDVANRVLRSGPISESVRDALDAELGEHDLAAAFARALKTERAYGVLAYNDLNLGKFWPARGYWNNAVIYYLDIMDEQITLAESPAAVGQTPPSGVTKPSSPWTVLADMVLTAIQAGSAANRRAQATQRCVRILNSATRLEQQGVAVAGLADLKLPNSVTIDPFSGQPLLMKKLPEGWLIYSVGANGKDDGGQLDGLLDIGLGPVPAVPSPN